MIFKKTDLDNAISCVAEGLNPNSYVILSTTITLYPHDGNLYLVTHPDDGEVWYSAKVGPISGDFPAVSVDGSMFNKAVSFCNDNVDITVTEDSLIIKNGKGELKLPLMVDDLGNLAHHEFFTPDGTSLVVSNLQQLKMVSANISKTMDSIALRNVYTDENCSFSTDFVNISKGDSIVNTPMLISGRMLSFFNKHADTQVLDAGEEFFWFVSAEDRCAARFSKVFQDFIPEFPLDQLKAEFDNPVKNAVKVDMKSFLNSLSFLAIVADSVDDYAVTISQENHQELILTCKQSTQKVFCDYISGDGPWSVTVDCTAAISKFSVYDGVVELDVYESQLACVGPVVTSIGLILED